MAILTQPAYEAAAHLMTAESARELLMALHSAGVVACVAGGWAVDALVGEQTRLHADLDLWVPAPDLDPLIRVMAARKVDRLLPWGGDRPWNFVLHDGHRLRVDLHLYETLPDGHTLHYGSASAGVELPAAALAGHGVIGGLGVRCEAPEWSLRFHTGYPPRSSDRHDVAQLTRRFGLPVPPPYADPTSEPDVSKHHVVI